MVCQHITNWSSNTLVLKFLEPNNNNNKSNWGNKQNNKQFEYRLTYKEDREGKKFKKNIQ